MPEQSSATDERLLRETLDTIAAERGNIDRAFDLVDEVVRKFGEVDLAERLYCAIPRERPWQDVADLFGILIWSTSDNGSAALMRTVERWLREAADVRQIQIAMDLDVYPFLEDDVMEQVLKDVATKYPEVSERCRELVESRKQGYNQTPERTGAADMILRGWKQLKRRLGR